jgi:hypothetical protein
VRLHKSGLPSPRFQGDNQEGEVLLSGPSRSRTLDVYFPEHDFTFGTEVRTDWEPLRTRQQRTRRMVGAPELIGRGSGA